MGCGGNVVVGEKLPQQSGTNNEEKLTIYN